MKSKTLSERIVWVLENKSTKENGEAIKEMALVIELSDQMVRHFTKEKGSIIPKVDVVGKIAKHYGVDLYWLVYGEGEPEVITSVEEQAKQKLNRLLEDSILSLEEAKRLT
jgi:ribosome-binding protein aMBF1 (putative translation factor)